MKNFQAVSSILGKPWLIDVNYVRAQLPFIASILKDETVLVNERVEKQEHVLCVTAGTFQVNQYTQFSSAPEGSIAVHDVRGALLKSDPGCGMIGTATRARLFQQADSSPNIKAHIMIYDTPGGEAYGIQTFEGIIKASPKPVISFVEDGMMASGGYWLGSAGDEIISSHKTNYIGSIGAYTTIADYTGAYELKGIKVKEIYAPQSTEKNKDHKDAWAGDESGIKAHLKFLTDNFIKSVKANRKGKINTEEHDPFKGGIFNSEKALKIGLIDGIGNFEYAVKRANELAAAASAPSPTTTNNKSNMKISLKGTMTALLGVFGLAIAAGANSVEFDASEENLTKLDAELKAGADAREQLANALKEKETAAAALATANATISENKIKIETLEGVIAKYGSAPGASSSAPVKTETDDLGEENKNSFINKEADHNKIAANFGL